MRIKKLKELVASRQKEIIDEFGESGFQIFINFLLIKLKDPRYFMYDSESLFNSAKNSTKLKLYYHVAQRKTNLH